MVGAPCVVVHETAAGFVELSQLLARTHNVQYVRDEFWKRAHAIRSRILQSDRAELAGPAYTALLSDLPSMSRKYAKALDDLSVIESNVTESYLGRSEWVILRFENRRNYSTPELGNALREVAFVFSDRLRFNAEVVLRPIHEELSRIISLRDEDILPLRSP